MSKLKVDEIRDLTDSTTIAPSIPGLQPQLAQAWVNFDGTGTVAIRDSYNVSSITDNGTGNYTVNFTSSFSSTGYSANVSCIQRNINYANLSTSSIDIEVFTAATSPSDTAFVTLSIFSN